MGDGDWKQFQVFRTKGGAKYVLANGHSNFGGAVGKGPAAGMKKKLMAHSEKRREPQGCKIAAKDESRAHAAQKKSS
jgi:hypothetical protein